MIGVEPLYSEIRTIPVAAAAVSWRTDDESDEAARVAVLGDNVRKQLVRRTRGRARARRSSSTACLSASSALMPAKNQNSSYNGLDGDKIYVPYSTMVRDLPPKDDNFHPGIVSDIIYVPASLDELEGGARAGDARAGAAITSSTRMTRARCTSGTRSKARNWWTAFSCR